MLRGQAAVSCRLPGCQAGCQGRLATRPPVSPVFPAPTLWLRRRDSLMPNGFLASSARTWFSRTTEFPTFDSHVGRAKTQGCVALRHPATHENARSRPLSHARARARAGARESAFMPSMPPRGPQQSIPPASTSPARARFVAVCSDIARRNMTRHERGMA